MWPCEMEAGPKNAVGVMKVMNNRFSHVKAIKKTLT